MASREPRTAEQALALAGLFQSVDQVRRIARRGVAEPGAFATCVRSTLRLDAESVAAVYGGVEPVAAGLRVLLDQLGAGPGARDRELTGYAARLLHLERRLSASQDALARLRAGIERIGALAEAGDPGDDPGGDGCPPVVIGELAALYRDTIGTVGPRVMVSGEPAYLRDARNAERIRALLLAGIRSAVLWRQLGGGRVRLILGRARMARASAALLRERGP